MLEVCIENVHGLEACVQSTVAQVELCSALSVGGLTPSIGLIKLAATTSINVRVLIRPRSGNFYFNKKELAVMCDDIALAVEAGANGVVIGVANQDNRLNVDALGQLVKAADTASLTLHRIIDTVTNPLDAMEQAIDLGFSAILSSGGQPRAIDGVELLAKMHAQASDRIQIIAGAGLTPADLTSIHQQTGITAFHSSCSNTQITINQTAILGLDSANPSSTDAGLINQYQLALSAIHAQ